MAPPTLVDACRGSIIISLQADHHIAVLVGAGFLAHLRRQPSRFRTNRRPILQRRHVPCEQPCPSHCSRRPPSRRSPRIPTRRIAAPGAAGAGRGGGPRPYDRVITPDAKTRRGLFAVHRIGDRLFFEIPRRELEQGPAADRPLRARRGAGPGRPRWRLRRRTPATSSPSAPCAGSAWATASSCAAPPYAITSSDTDRIGATARSRTPTTRRSSPSFNVEAYGPDSAPVIDVTRLFTTAIPEVAGDSAARSTPNRSFIERHLAFPDNIEHRGHADRARSRARGRAWWRRRRWRRGAPRPPQQRAGALQHRAPARAAR